MATLLLVEDHPLFQEGFAHMVRALRPEWAVLLASSAEAALAQDRTGARIDLAIVDINLPDNDGFALCRAFAATAPPLPCLMISARDDAGAKIRASAIARGLIGKSASPEEIVAAIEAALSGDVAATSGREALPELTLRQAEVLELLAQGLGNKEIRHRLGIAERTVRAHLTELFLLLGAHSRTQAILRARDLGLIA